MKLKIFLSSITILIFTACHQYDNFTTYFNTYYNMNRILKESKEEFQYQDEKKRVKPRVLVPETHLEKSQKIETSLPPFLEEFIIAPHQRQPVAVKLDSIIIKGSKILSKHSKSDYIQGTLYLMAQSYFFQSLWLNAQIKCSELIDRFPDGEFSPDAHILLAKALLIQRKFNSGKIVLSRTVDIAWQLGRYDILSEAFRIQAELALFLKEYDEAVKPYKQAIIQADDNLYKAKWQFDLAALVFRMGKFEKAEKLFRDVHRYSPDYVTQFEAYLYQASCLARIGKYEKAEEILKNLETDGKFEEWVGNVFAERMNIYRLKGMDEDFSKGEKFADTTYIGNDAMAAMYYERGLDYFKDNDYSDARIYFAKAKSTLNPATKEAIRIYKLLDTWNRTKAQILPTFEKIQSDMKIPTKEQEIFARNLFEMARVQERMGNLDSAEYYYDLATKYTIPENSESARYFYAKARFYESYKPLVYDSLMEYVIEKYPRTDYGQDAIKRMGYTENFLIDSVAELYNSGFSLFKNKEYDFAIRQFTKVFNYYPQSKYAPKAIYSIAWIYEKELERDDIAFVYYQYLTKNYPKSEYSNHSNRLVTYTTLINDKKPIPDSLKDYPIMNYNPKIKQILMMAEKDSKESKTEDEKRKKSGSTELEDIISDPFKIFEDAKESVIDGANEVLDEQKKNLDKVSSPDSLQNLLPGIKINDPFKDLKKSSKDKNKEKEKKENKKKEKEGKEEIEKENK